MTPDSFHVVVPLLEEDILAVRPTAAGPDRTIMIEFPKTEVGSLSPEFDDFVRIAFSALRNWMTDR